MNDRSPISGGDAREKIEITEEMIRAGRGVLYRSGRLQYEALGADDLLIRSIYRAMIRVLGQAIREGPWVVGQPRERVPRISDPIGIYSLLFGHFTLPH